jgi:trk system potassium uptake protein
MYRLTDTRHETFSSSQRMSDKTPPHSLKPTAPAFVKSLVSLLTEWEKPFLYFGLGAVVIQHGAVPDKVVRALGIAVVVAMIVRALRVGLLWSYAKNRDDYWSDHKRVCLLSSLWLGGVIIGLTLGGVIFSWHGNDRLSGLFAWSEVSLLLMGTSRLLIYVSKATHRRNPASIFVASFLVLIVAGTLLLMLPGSQTEAAQKLPLLQQLRIALFTSTSASCVTGLVVVPTGGELAHWSRFGQVVIMTLFQIGGLGMMSISAIYVLIVGRQLEFRESAAVTQVTDAITPREVRRLLLSVMVFTVGCELIGALFLSSLWVDELSASEQMFFGLFHSISAFCNAGFSLTENSFVGYAARWQVWSVLCGLIIIGGLGFSTLTHLFRAGRQVWRNQQQPLSLFSRRRWTEQLTLSTRIIMATTFTLLIGGAIVYFLLESGGSRGDDPPGERIAESWFQSVTFRTAGFNSINHDDMRPATKLFAIVLMFIGASPGSTGGGVKTVAIAIILLSVIAIARGRQNVECQGRTIPDDQVRYAFVLFGMSLIMTIAVAIFIALFENKPEEFLNQLFEATSAFATVGVSTGITSTLTTPSQLVIIVAMFVGRVGPITLLLSLKAQKKTINYSYPEERISLG